MNRREMCIGLAMTTSVLPNGRAVAQATFRQIEWQLDAASGLIVGGQGTWQGQTLSGQRLLPGRLSVLHIVGTQGEDLLIAVETKKAQREPEVKQCAAFALLGSLWQPVDQRLLVAARQGGWIVRGTLVRGGI